MINGSNCIGYLHQPSTNQQANGHPDIYATVSGVIISCIHPFLHASPDASVYDPSNADPWWANSKRRQASSLQAAYITGITRLQSTYIKNVANERNPKTRTNAAECYYAHIRCAKLESQMAVKKMDSTRDRNEIKARNIINKHVQKVYNYVYTKWQAAKLRGHSVGAAGVSSCVRFSFHSIAHGVQKSRVVDQTTTRRH